MPFRADRNGKCIHAECTYPILKGELINAVGRGLVHAHHAKSKQRYLATQPLHPVAEEIGEAFRSWLALNEYALMSMGTRQAMEKVSYTVGQLIGEQRVSDRPTVKQADRAVALTSSWLISRGWNDAAKDIHDRRHEIAEMIAE